MENKDPFKILNITRELETIYLEIYSDKYHHHINSNQTFGNYDQY